MLEANTVNSSDESLFLDKKPKLITEIIQPLTEREAEPGRAMKTHDGYGHQMETFISVS